MAKSLVSAKRFRCKACGHVFEAPQPDEEPEEILDPVANNNPQASIPNPPSAVAPVARSIVPSAAAGAKIYDVLPDPKPEAIVVHCHDPRFQTAFDQFIQDELKLAPGQYVRLVVGGGAGVLANPLKLPKEFRFMRDRFEYLRERFPAIKRIILINHEGCGYYGTLKDRVLNYVPERLKNHLADLPREDLKLIEGIFAHLLPHLGLKLECYYAKYADLEHTKIVFERLAG